MQKNYIISCCAECPAFLKNKNFCKKSEKKIHQNRSMSVDSIFLGFPDWCPLSSVEVVGDSLDAELNKISRQILKNLHILPNDDIVVSISHYLSKVVDIKKKELPESF
jgi:hypothetical protein